MVLQIKQIYKQTETFDFPKANHTNKNKIINSLNPEKATGSDRILSKLVKNCR